MPKAQTVTGKMYAVHSVCKKSNSTEQQEWGRRAMFLTSRTAQRHLEEKI